jgi:DNA-binding transcriptional MerR regulator
MPGGQRDAAEQEQFGDVGRGQQQRYPPQDVAIAGLIRRLLAAGSDVDGIRMLKRLAERGIQSSSAASDQAALLEDAQRILYQRKAFREETGMDEEHYPQAKLPPAWRPATRPRAARRTTYVANAADPDESCETIWPPSRSADDPSLANVERPVLALTVLGASLHHEA